MAITDAKKTKLTKQTAQGLSILKNVYGNRKSTEVDKSYFSKVGLLAQIASILLGKIAHKLDNEPRKVIQPTQNHPQLSSSHQPHKIGY
uniref:DUF4372 domain-containing protein n=1 Tax=Panagrellus redivivus TaxID=6233 RepID=A0A7E4VEH3_PANRE